VVYLVLVAAKKTQQDGPKLPEARFIVARVVDTVRSEIRHRVFKDVVTLEPNDSNAAIYSFGRGATRVSIEPMADQGWQIKVSVNGEPVPGCWPFEVMETGGPRSLFKRTDALYEALGAEYEKSGPQSGRDRVVAALWDFGVFGFE
jgi:hypothetical protein